MPLEIKVDAQSALARFSPAGIPEKVRANLRATIPGIMRNLTAQIDSNLGALKSRTHLQIKGGPQGQMVENATQIIGRALRTATDKEYALILDHSDTTQRLGFVTDIIQEHLDDGKLGDKKPERVPPLPKGRRKR
jgi:hypothetical protein